MSNRTIDLGGARLTAAHDWNDITHTLSGSEHPRTLAKLHGGGALQLSLALYRDGQVPQPLPSELLEMVRELGSAHDLGTPSQEVTESAPIRLAAATFHARGDFIRVWYVSDGYSIAKVTYLSAEGDEEQEVAECESMVRTVRFDRQRAP